MKPSILRFAAVALIAALALPVTASADHILGNIPWTALLPPLPGVPANAHPVTPCGPHPPASCVEHVIARMIENWTPLDHACDPRAVFALVYLRTTQAFRASLGTGFWDDEDAMISLDRVFADLYFSAVDAYPTGTAPEAWRIAFDASRDGRTEAIQDVFLGMNAHIQRDLPVALAAVGLVQADGSSRKPDHDRVDEILSENLDLFADEVAARYDPTLKLADASPSPVDEMTALEVLKAWREGAWRNAERLASARSDAERSTIMAQIEAVSVVWAHLIEAADFSWYADRRLAYCHAAQNAA